MQFKRVIDLSHPLRPGREARRLEITPLPATHITGATPEEGWYIMHAISMDNHLGTHLEVPYHCLPHGADLARLPVEQFVGEAVILDLRGYAAQTGILVQDVQAAAQRAGGIHKGDMVFCMTGWSRYYGSDVYRQPPFLTRDAVRWLVDQGIKVLGIDTMGVMDPAFSDRQNHLPLFEAGMIYIENLTNLEAAPASRVMAVALPPAVEGLEGLPVRVVVLL